MEILKLVLTASTTTNVVPTVTRFFRRTLALVIGPATLTVQATDFLKDDGTAATSLPALPASNSYYNVYINGIMQMGGLSTYTPGGAGVGKLEIAVPTGQTIALSTVIVLEIVSYAPTSSTIVT
ncbi:DUF4183 domain-containing protein [Brevibacillus sp. SAFN-007a]|uniref:DUF4183 domain-containing protein n=1 Tax=Brevibacillus sp. SAFN-007a TaxID=3436862 RepID=UPI003F822575